MKLTTYQSVLRYEELERKLNQAVEDIIDLTQSRADVITDLLFELGELRVKTRDKSKRVFSAMIDVMGLKAKAMLWQPHIYMTCYESGRSAHFYMEDVIVNGRKTSAGSSYVFTSCFGNAMLLRWLDMNEQEMKKDIESFIRKRCIELLKEKKKKGLSDHNEKVLRMIKKAPCTQSI